MATCLNGDELLSFAEAARLLPGHPNPSTLWRWRTRGIDGIKLATVRVGGRRFVSRAALNEFISAVTRTGESSIPSDASVARSQETTLRLKASGLLP
jgi:Protein of unknown function (DUF1580)